MQTTIDINLALGQLSNELKKVRLYEQLKENMLQQLEREPNSIKLNTALSHLANIAENLNSADVRRIILAASTNKALRSTYDVPQDLEKIFLATKHSECAQLWIELCAQMPNWQPNSKRITGGDDWTGLKALIWLTYGKAA